MKINKINSTQNFKGMMTNKLVLGSLEKISDHGTSFIAGTTLLMASVVRPFVISKTPDVEKENKKYAMANSIASGLVKFAMVEALALPVENAVKKIDKNPQNYLNSQTINRLKDGSKNLLESKNYQFGTQLLKLGTGLISAIPKTMITIALIPFLTDFIFPKKTEKTKKQLSFNADKNSVFAPFFEKENTPSFKGGLIDTTAKGIGRLFNNKNVQDFIVKHSSNNENIARNISIATDILLTASFVHRTNKSKKIKENRKKPLIYNNLISTGVSILLGYSTDNFVKNNTKSFIDKFAKANKNNPNLPKYIQGINIIRPTLIFAGIYYGLLPLFSTYMADKTDKYINKKSKSV